MINNFCSSEIEIDQVWESYLQNHDEYSKSLIVEYYFSFVKRIASKVAESIGWRMQPDELASFGVDGLYKAIDLYDPNRGVSFKSYAAQRIHGSMLDGLRREDRVPRSVRMHSDRFEKCRQKLQHQYGRRVDDAEVASLLGLSKEEFNTHYRKYLPSMIASIDPPSSENEDEYIKQDSNHNLTDDDNSPDLYVAQREFFSKLLSKNFNKTDRKLIYYYYYKNFTMQQVAEKIGLSESRVSQIHKELLDRLYDKIKRNPGYFDDEIYNFIGP